MWMWSTCLEYGRLFFDYQHGMIYRELWELHPSTKLEVAPNHCQLQLSPPPLKENRKLVGKYEYVDKFRILHL